MNPAELSLVPRFEKQLKLTKLRSSEAKPILGFGLESEVKTSKCKISIVQDYVENYEKLDKERTSVGGFSQSTADFSQGELVF